MEAAKNSLERILEAAGKLKDRKDNAAKESITGEELELLKEAEGFVTKFEDAMMMILTQQMPWLQSSSLSNSQIQM